MQLKSWLMLINVDCPETEVNFCQTTTSSTTPCCWESMRKIPRTIGTCSCDFRTLGHGKMRYHPCLFFEDHGIYRNLDVKKKDIRLSANQIRLEFPISFAYKLCLLLCRWSKFEANKRIGWLWYVMIDIYIDICGFLLEIAARRS